MGHELPGHGEIQLWCAPLETLLRQEERWTSLLSDDEHRRAARYRREFHQRRFRARRGLLRHLLGRSLGEPAAQLTFQYGPQGKPVLASALAFSLSDSHEWVVYALTTHGPVGVDVEAVQPIAELDSLIARFFAPREAQALRSLPADERLAAFYQGWTRKEALVKAVGVGLSWPLDQLDVLDRSEFTPAGGPSWGLQSLTPVDGYVVSVAAEGTDWHVRLRLWPDDETASLPFRVP